MTEIGEKWELDGFRKMLLALAETGERYTTGKIDRLIGEMEGRYLRPRGVKLTFHDRATIARDFRARSNRAREWKTTAE